VILKQAVDKLMKTDIRIEKPDDLGYWRINVCSQAEYNKKSGSITIEFTDRIMPYLAQVKQRFVLYNLKEISNFGSLYTTRLYELIQEFKETGWMLKSVKQLRDAFAVGEHKFKLYADLKKYTFGHACQEINANYDMNLNFEEVKEGRKIVAVRFSFKKMTVKQVTNNLTGVTRNVYSKPDKKYKSNLTKGVLKGQIALSF
jgi:plasmid replication initiation protein